MKFKKAIALLGAAAILSGSLCACTDLDRFKDSEKLSETKAPDGDITKTYNYSYGLTSAPTSYNSYSGVINEFSFRMLREKNLEEKDSFVFSPAMSAIQLSELINGASGDCRLEILGVLGSSLSADDFNVCSSYFKSRMEQVSQTGKTKKQIEEESPLSSEHTLLYSSFWVNSGTDITSAFLQANADYYGSDVLRFKYDDSHTAAKLVNLLNDSAGKKLELPGGVPSGSDKLYTLSAVDITDKWLVDYAPDSVFEGSFKSGKGSEKKVQFMSSDESYLSTADAEGVVKYTAKNPLRLIAVMPKDGLDIDEYIKSFTAEKYSGLMKSMDVSSRVRAELPQFSFDGKGETASDSGLLQKCGLYTLFTDDAHFKGMNISDTLKLGDMLELKPTLTVCAQGILNKAVNASSASGALLPQSKGSEESPSAPAKADKTLRFDKPFLFLLTDNETGIPVYAGIFR